jgi:hypothetical protein
MGSALRSPINKRYLAELVRAWVGRTDLFKKLKIFGVHPPTLICSQIWKGHPLLPWHVLAVHDCHSNLKGSSQTAHRSYIVLCNFLCLSPVYRYPCSVTGFNETQGDASQTHYHYACFLVSLSCWDSPSGVDWRRAQSQHLAGESQRGYRSVPLRNK